MDDAQDLVNTLDLATRLDVPAEWLREEARANRIPHLWVRRRLLFSIKAVRSALAMRAAEPPIVVPGEGS